MFNPIIVLYTYFPEKLAFRVLLIVALAAACTALLDLLWRNGKLGRNKARGYTVLLLYILALFFVIVLGRRTQTYTRIVLNPIPGFVNLFSSGSINNWPETVLNIVAFVPIGILTYAATKRVRVIKSVLAGFLLSALFEALQYVLRNGYCEVRDILNNTLGTLLGAALGIILIIIIKKRRAD